MTTEAPDRPPADDWEARTLFGAGNLGGLPVQALMTPRDRSEGPWYRPAQMWRASDRLCWAESWSETCCSGEPGRHFAGREHVVVASYRVAVEQPPGSMLDDFLEVTANDAAERFALSWGPLGTCSCRWSGQPFDWWGSLHAAHTATINYHLPGQPERVLTPRSECLSTWVQLRQRTWNTVMLGAELLGLGDPTMPRPADALGRAWPTEPRARAAILSLELERWRQVGGVRHQVEAGGGETLVTVADGLLGWLALNVLGSIGTVGEQRVPCQSCGRLFVYGPRRKYCGECGDPRRVSARRAQRKSRQKRRDPGS